MEIGDILKNLGDMDETEPSKWDEVIQPKSSYLITGDVGMGKSGLAYFILERYSQKYSLTPAVVGLPKGKRTLLPGNFEFLSDMSQIPATENAIVFIDEADIQLPLDSNKNKEAVINFLSLPRQRHQLFILAYHFPRLVKGTYLPFFSAFLFKRPPYLLEFASKKGSDELMQMMTKAGERFDEMTSEKEIREHTYIVAPRIRWQGILENPLPSFWSEELSEIWSGVGIECQGDRLVVVSNQLELSPEVLRNRLKAEGLQDPYWHNVKELQKMCLARGLPTTGNKDALVIRLFGLN